MGTMQRMLMPAVIKCFALYERLFWRWGAHAAVLEMPFKLIRLGDRPPMLFDVTTPDGETVTRDLAASRPDVVSRLDKHLTAWAADLVPPGIPPAGFTFGRPVEEAYRQHRLAPGSTD